VSRGVNNNDFLGKGGFLEIVSPFGIVYYRKTSRDMKARCNTHTPRDISQDERPLEMVQHKETSREMKARCNSTLPRGSSRDERPLEIVYHIETSRETKPLYNRVLQ